MLRLTVDSKRVRIISGTKTKEIAKETVDKNIKTQELNDLYRILDFYTTEWIHRDERYWSVTVKLFYASLIVTVLPYTKLLDLSALPKYIPMVFPILGAVLSGISMYISLSLAQRLSVIGERIQKIADLFPNGLRWKDNKKEYNLLHGRLTPRLSVLMFSALLALSLLLIPLQ